jgi:predicted ArsR family transcriptional regulator
MAAEDVTTSPAPSNPDFDRQVSSIATLGDSLRRALYRYVISRAEPVNRHQVAEGAGVARHVVKFHLDRLAEVGLLAVEYARPAGRRGPGAGRPAKLYRRSARELAVSLPQRDYQLAARLLARAVTDAEREGVAVGVALGQAARRTGRALGDRARRIAGARPTSAGLLAAATGVLVECGYEPRPDGTGLVLANCPFHGLVEEHTDLVCEMNLDLLSGLLDGLQHPELTSRLEPTPGLCCVQLRTADDRAAESERGSPF